MSSSVYSQCSGGVRVFAARDMEVWTNLCRVTFSPVHSRSLSSPPFSFCQPFPSLRSIGSLNPARPGERCKLPLRGLQGRSPSRHWIWCILTLKSGCNKFIDFLRISWPNFVHNLQILYRIWKHANSAKTLKSPWSTSFLTASKTVTGQSGSSTVL